MMKVVYCTYDIDEMPIALRNKILEGTTVEKIYHSQEVVKTNNNINQIEFDIYL